MGPMTVGPQREQYVARRAVAAHSAEGKLRPERPGLYMGGRGKAGRAAPAGKPAWKPVTQPLPLMALLPLIPGSAGGQPGYGACPHSAAVNSQGVRRGLGTAVTHAQPSAPRPPHTASPSWTPQGPWARWWGERFPHCAAKPGFVPLDLWTRWAGSLGAGPEHSPRPPPTGAESFRAGLLLRPDPSRGDRFQPGAPCPPW